MVSDGDDGGVKAWFQSNCYARSRGGDSDFWVVIVTACQGGFIE